MTEAMESASALIDAKIDSIADWRGPMLERLRSIIKAAQPGVVEEIKWRKPSNPTGVPVWSLDGVICTGETYKTTVKLTFAKGASLEDPDKVFNASLDGGTRRAIDFREGDVVNERALQKLVQDAVALNRSKPSRGGPAGGGR